LRDKSEAFEQWRVLLASQVDNKSSFPPNGIAVVIGSTGGIGAALLERVTMSGGFSKVIGISRSTEPSLDLLDEASIEALAARLQGKELRLVIDATGFLHDEERKPERSWKNLDPQAMAYSYAINAIGPALLMKHLLPLLPRQGKSVFATLSAKVGSIGDNRLGGWYSYRAAKAALNQMTRSASIELGRRWPDAICVALHPGTVQTQLTTPFAKSGLDVQTPEQAAENLLGVIDGLSLKDSGHFFDFKGSRLPW
jgi:NAD(P)-dependent dehydrogenase (short-subunit alcohol dehydrogenase family)